VDSDFKFLYCSRIGMFKKEREGGGGEMFHECQCNGDLGERERD